MIWFLIGLCLGLLTAFAVEEHAYRRWRQQGISRQFLTSWFLGLAFYSPRFTPLLHVIARRFKGGPQRGSKVTPLTTRKGRRYATQADGRGAAPGAPGDGGAADGGG